MFEYQPIDKYKANVKSFQLQFNDTIGVISITEDNWDGSSIIVLMDSSKFNKGSLPESYEGLDVHVLDVYGERDSFKKVIADIKEQYPDIKDSEMPFAFFLERIQMLENILTKYERKQ